jgi:site-specific DNA-methyltransferase (adenine-specific)
MTSSIVHGEAPIYYEDESVQLIHGDALDVMVQQAREGLQVDAVVTDPPYSSGGAMRSDKMRDVVDKYASSGVARDYTTFDGDHRDQRAYFAWSHLWLSLARNITVPGGDLLAFIDWRQLPTLSDAVQSAGWQWQGVGVWNKGFGRPNRGRFTAGHELVLHATNGPKEPVERYTPAVFSAPIEPDKVHLSQKPVAVMEWCLNLIAPGAKVLEPFAGSGTTLVAVKATGRYCIGIEADKQHLETIAKRCQETLRFA